MIMTKDQLKQKVEFDGFSEEEMVKFGNYIFSLKNKIDSETNDEIEEVLGIKEETVELAHYQRLVNELYSNSEVHHSDLENFKQTLI